MFSFFRSTFDVGRRARRSFSEGWFDVLFLNAPYLGPFYDRTITGRTINLASAYISFYC